MLHSYRFLREEVDFYEGGFNKIINGKMALSTRTTSMATNSESFKMVFTVDR